MLKNAYLLEEIFADTAENERHFAENLPKIGNYSTARQPAAGGGVGPGRLPEPLRTEQLRRLRSLRSLRRYMPVPAYVCMPA